MLLRPTVPVPVPFLFAVPSLMMEPPAMIAPEPTQDSWESLVHRLREQDGDAAREAVDRLHPHVARIVAAHRPRHEESADLIQETFLRVFSKISQYQGRQPFPHWVARITVNVCLSRLRHHRRRPLVFWSDLGEAEQLAFEQAGQSEAVDPDRAGAKALILRLLDTLKTQDRLLLTWLELEQRTIAEIVDLTGWSSTLVRVRSFRARNRLRKALESLESPSPSAGSTP